MVKGKVEAASEIAVADKLRTMGNVPLEVRAAQRRHAARDQLRPQEEGQAQGPRRDLPAVRDHDRRRPHHAARPRPSSPNRPRTRSCGASFARSSGDVEAGLSLSEAFAKHDVFPPLMVNMTRAGEAGGFLDVTHAPDRRQLRGRGEAARQDQGRADLPGRRPHHGHRRCASACSSSSSPSSRACSTELGGELPLPTQVLVFLSTTMKYVLPRMIVVGIVGLVWWRKNGKTEARSARSSTR